MFPLLLPLLLSIFVEHAQGEFPEYPMTVTEMEVMAGYCTSGGMYLGGKPALDDLSKKIYECLADSYFLTSALDKTTSNTTSSAADTGHATACMHWRVDEFAGSTFQSGSCECKFVENEAFCSAWVCVQAEEVENCDIGGGDCYVATNTEVGLCLCDVENDSGLYCESWSCKQVDSEGREQYEEYHCQRESISGQYCEAWNGNVTASNKIEVVTCECVAERSGDRVCSYWECEELGVDTCVSTRWCNLRVSVGIGGGLGCLGIILLVCGLNLCNSKERYHGKVPATFYVLFAITWCLAWSSFVVLWGNVDEATIVGSLVAFPVAQVPTNA